MTAKQVSVGLTYNVKFGEVISPVTLTRECPFGGWYGKNEATGETVRIATAARLDGQVSGDDARREARLQELTVSNIHTSIKENNNMPTSTVETRTARSNRRAASKPAATPTPTPTKEVTVTTKPAAKRKPAAKTAAKKPAAKRGTVKLANAVPAEAKQATLLTQEQADQMVAAAVEKAVAAFMDNSKPTKPAAKRTAKRVAKTPAKPVVITLEPRDPKVNSYSFKYVGKDENPLVTAVYLTIPLLEQFAQDGSPVEIAFTPYVPSGKQKPQPKSKIRYSGDADTIRDLYVDREGITALGYSETNCPVVTVQVIKGNKVTLTFQYA